MPSIPGAAIRPLTLAECSDLLSWVAHGTTQPEGTGEPVWALAQCDDGVIWGHRRTGDRSWVLSCAVFPELSASLTPARLQELRLFGPAEELLIWRGDATLTGRRLAEQAQPGGWADCEPIPDTRVLIGDRYRQARDGFTLVADGGGSCQAVPLDCPRGAFERSGRTGAAESSWPLRLHLRHYLNRDDATGAVRVVASRLVDVTCDGSEP